MRIMGIDYGDSRIGIAMSDIMGWTAQGIKTIKNKGDKKTIEEISIILNEYNPEKIVVGLPKNMDGTEGFRADETYKFIDNLKSIFNGEIILWDERLSTVGASRYLDSTETYGKRRKNVIDTVAATLILEGYLNSIKK